MYFGLNWGCCCLTLVSDWGRIGEEGGDLEVARSCGTEMVCACDERIDFEGLRGREVWDKTTTAKLSIYEEPYTEISETKRRAILGSCEKRVKFS